MAHYIADLIRRADDAPEGHERENLRNACATEILRLWSHRRSFRSSSRPMASFEPLYRALERLDPQRPRGTYFRLIDDPASMEGGTKTAALLAVAMAVEDTARNAVRELVLMASQAASQAEAKWLDLSKNIENDESALLDKLADLLHAAEDDETEMSPSDKQQAKTVRGIQTLAEAAHTAINLLRKLSAPAPPRE